jgi:hypothetical protein
LSLPLARQQTWLGWVAPSSIYGECHHDASAHTNFLTRFLKSEPNRLRPG